MTNTDLNTLPDSHWFWFRRTCANINTGDTFTNDAEAVTCEDCLRHMGNL